MTNSIDYFIGVDGGGSGTRVRVQDAVGHTVGQATGGPSGLGHGIAAAWATIEAVIDAAFADAKLARPAYARLALGLGLAGVHNRQWAAQFVAADPGFAKLVLETDAYTTLLGAHGGQPGAIVALGTGSVGEALRFDGHRVEVGGWGFPVGDEASGALLGLRAMTYTQQALDGRAQAGQLSDAVLAACGGQSSALFNWLAQANQTRYAQLAPLVIEHAATDPAARQIMQQAGREVAKMAKALDPKGKLPLALCGGLATAMQPWLPKALQNRLRPPQQDAVGGALHLLRQPLLRQPSLRQAPGGAAGQRLPRVA
jgi:glucosamine kinase